MGVASRGSRAPLNRGALSQIARQMSVKITLSVIFMIIFVIGTSKYSSIPINNRIDNKITLLQVHPFLLNYLGPSSISSESKLLLLLLLLDVLLSESVSLLSVELELLDNLHLYTMIKKK